MRIDVLTLFPEMFTGVLGASILKRAADPSLHPDGQVPATYHLTNIRDYTHDKHDKVDKAPYGGGPGMVLQCQPVWDAVQAVEAQQPDIKPLRILLSPQGEPLTHQRVEQLAAQPRLLLLAGHYEGLDERVIEALSEDGGLTQISIGDYVLSGGEIAAMVLIDAVVRLLPGVLGDEDSALHESFSSDLQGGLDYPHYTRPAQWQGRGVPDVLLSGNHAQIEAWRRLQSQQRTSQRRPDLLK
ncbi:MAG: tRNA (guanosine(37)-N1)-methyltransferase TrmD [Phycisphaeraceae bacterium]|nr:tRNA (guanosine(37)-N1)-methyltransferase TrmD [Phycisphaeraceae bacterium]